MLTNDAEARLRAADVLEVFVQPYCVDCLRPFDVAEARCNSKTGELILDELSQVVRAPSAEELDRWRSARHTRPVRGPRTDGRGFQPDKVDGRRYYKWRCRGRQGWHADRDITHRADRLLHEVREAITGGTRASRHITIDGEAREIVVYRIPV